MVTELSRETACLKVFTKEEQENVNKALCVHV